MMERLTSEIIENINGVNIKTRMVIPNEIVEGYKELEEWYQRCAEKLFEYEDLEEQGLLIKLPCKIGDTVYVIRNCTAPSCEICRGYKWLDNCVKEHKSRIFELSFKISMLDLFNKTVFLTREEAKMKLKEEK